MALFLLAGMAACGYWRRRKIYESSASQTLSHANGLFPTPTPSDDTPLYGPPLPFLPPAAYPAPPPYSEAARPSYDRLDHRHLYEALLSGIIAHLEFKISRPQFDSSLKESSKVPLVVWS